MRSRLLLASACIVTAAALAGCGSSDSSTAVVESVPADSSGGVASDDACGEGVPARGSLNDPVTRGVEASEGVAGSIYNDSTAPLWLSMSQGPPCRLDPGKAAAYAGATPPGGSDEFLAISAGATADSAEGTSYLLTQPFNQAGKPPGQRIVSVAWIPGTDSRCLREMDDWTWTSLTPGQSQELTGNNSGITTAARPAKDDASWIGRAIGPSASGYRDWAVVDLRISQLGTCLPE